MRNADLLLAGLASVVWGTIYLVATRWLPQGYPLTVSLIRALPAGLLLLVLERELPKGVWLSRVVVLGGLNFPLFWSLLFVSAYGLPGGVAAAVNALQPVFVVALSWLLLGAPLRPSPVAAALGGVLGRSSGPSTRCRARRAVTRPRVSAPERKRRRPAPGRCRPAPSTRSSARRK
jgi:probable blue pigment (indigoidine) exporter